MRSESATPRRAPGRPRVVAATSVGALLARMTDDAMRAAAIRDLVKRQRRHAIISAMTCKVCRSCGETKPLSEFGPSGKAADGLQRSCRKCAAARIASKPPRVRKAGERDDRAANRARCRAWSARNREADRARAAVRYAVKTGKLLRPACCEAEGCSERAKLQAHHASYDAADRLNVCWLCHRHHKICHALGEIALKPGLDQSLGRAPEKGLS